MESGEVKCASKLNKINILHRASLRGLKKCPSCGAINGQRAFICRNDNCDLRKRMLAEFKPFDPVQLITRSQVRLFSLRTKEKLTNVRNFVRFSPPFGNDTLSLSLSLSLTQVGGGGGTGSGIAGVGDMLAEQAECFVDSCRYDPTNGTATGCKHVKACSVAGNIPLAEAYPVERNVLWGLSISEEQKQRLWQLYCHNEADIQPVQRLNSSMFVVTCERASNFPAGRLHVSVFANCLTNKKGFYSCACKKLKIVVEADNTIIMKKEICDHILLLVAAIINHPNGKAQYSAFLDSLQHIWMPMHTQAPAVDTTSAMTPPDSNEPKAHHMDSMSMQQSPCPDDIFSFSEDLFAENSIPDFSDIILDTHSAQQLPSLGANSCFLNSADTNGLHIKDAKLNCSLQDEDFDFNFPSIEATAAEPISSSTLPVDVPPIHFNENSLSAMDQFQLGEDINVSNENLALANDIESLNSLAEVTQFANDFAPAASIKTETPPHAKIPFQTTNHQQAPPCHDAIAKSILVKPNVPQIYLNKSVIVKQSPVQIIKLATPGTIQKLPKIDKKFVQISKIDSSKLIVLKPKPKPADCPPVSIQPINSLSVSSTVPSPPAMDDSQQCTALTPSLSYEAWLDHIIEILNDSIILQDSNNIKHTFHVHEDMFTHFSNTFGYNNQRRLPNTSTIIRTGKHKDLIKHTWYFNQAAAVTRIFSTRNSNLELQRSSERLKEGSFVPFFPKISSEITVTKFRPIQSKEAKNRVFLKFSNAPESAMDKHECDKTGLKLEWLPSAFPRSHFGLMTIEFCVYTYTKNGHS